MATIGKVKALDDLVPTIIGEIDRRIGNGTLQPGQRLVEPEIAAMLGVGRVPVREAIRILAGEGIVEIVHGKGARVRSTDGRSVLEMVKVLHALTNTALADFLEHDDWLARCDRLADMNQCLATVSEQGDSLRIMRAIGSYRWTLALLCENRFLHETLRKMRLNLYYAQLIEAVGHDVIARCGRRYDAITKALRRRDLEEAVDLTNVNVQQLVRAIKRAGDAA